MRSPPFRDAGRSRDRQEVTNRLARLSRCPCPRVVHHTCARACASALASGTALSRIHKRSNYIALTCTPQCARTCVLAGLYVRVHIALFRNQDISGESDAIEGDDRINSVDRLDRSDRDDPSLIDKRRLSIVM